MKDYTDFFKEIEVEHIFFGSGARNAPLLESLDFCDITHGYDERSLAFQALGRAKLTKRPQLVCTTSGTAVAECLPAVIEAYYSNLPLIILSADRPKALKETHSPQTIKQESILSDFCRSVAYDQPVEFKGFPIHINLSVNTEGLKSMAYQTVNIDQVQFDLSQTLFLINKIEDSIFVQKLEKMIKEKNLICYQEVESPLYKNHFQNEILYDEQVQDYLQKNIIKTIVRIGQTPNSKFWRLLNNKLAKVDVYHLNLRNKPALGFGKIIPYESRHDLLYKLDQIDILLESAKEFSINHVFERYPKSEASLFREKIKQIDRPGEVLFIGNSMPIRYLKLIKPKHLKILANRGANGIDGLIATAIGISKATTENVHLILGDLSFQYDLSSLISASAKNLHITVMNNYGGQIFKNIDVPNEIINHHHHNFSYLFKYFEESFAELNEIQCDNKETDLFWKDFNQIWGLEKC
ncbi:MAG: thiamine pyrophosphate-binding protein [Bacteriovoracaceae bacterium]